MTRRRDRTRRPRPRRSTNQFIGHKKTSRKVPSCFIMPESVSVFEDDAEAVPARARWKLYCAGVPELQCIAMHVLSKHSSACSVERLWSLFGVVDRLVRRPARAARGKESARRCLDGRELATTRRKCAAGRSTRAEVTNYEIDDWHETSILLRYNVLFFWRALLHLRCSR